MKRTRFWQAVDFRSGTNLRAISALFFALMSPLSYVGAQQDAGKPSVSAQSEWVFNFVGTPLMIRSTGNKSYELTNQASARTQKYTLGCVHLDAKKGPTIVYRMKPEEIQIEPAKSWGTLFMHGNPDRFTCEKRNSRLSVTDVVFENAAEWHAPADPH